MARNARKGAPSSVSSPREDAPTGRNADMKRLSSKAKTYTEATWGHQERREHLHAATAAMLGPSMMLTAGANTVWLEVNGTKYAWTDLQTGLCSSEVARLLDTGKIAPGCDVRGMFDPECKCDYCSMRMQVFRCDLRRHLKGREQAAIHIVRAMEVEGNSQEVMEHRPMDNGPEAIPHPSKDSKMEQGKTRTQKRYLRRVRIKWEHRLGRQQSPRAPPDL
jgi:hypothetical protein